MEVTGHAVNGYPLFVGVFSELVWLAMGILACVALWKYIVTKK